MNTSNKPRSSLRLRSVLAASIALVSICAIPARAATQQELEAKLQALADEVDALRSELKQVKADQQVTATTPVSTLTPDVASNASSSRDISTSNEGLSFFGYGQVDYARPSDNPSDTTETVSRFVVGMNKQFDERTRLVSELEIENAVSSAEDPGEVEVEQVYIEREFNDRVFGKVGLFLVPSGLLNENHEP